MKRAVCLLLALLLLSAAAGAESLRLTGELSGTLYWPELEKAETALYTYVYAYPQVEALTEDAQEAAEAINELYRYTVSDVIAFDLPIKGENADPAAGPAATAVSFEITCATDDWFSVLVRTQTREGDWSSDIYAGHVFAVHSAKPGNVITLPYLLGILAQNENDTWLQDRQTAKADECVRQMVWEALESRVAAGELALLEDFDYETFCGVFYPEEDFYLDADANPVFFLEPGFAADASLGLLIFPVPLEDILDEI